MTDSKLRTVLQPIIQEYGLGMVLKTLGDIADARSDNLEQPATSPDGTTSGTTKKRPRVTAPEYVKGMALPADKSVGVTELAERFHQKTFLPTFGDVANFCEMYKIELPASRSRVNAIRRIFEFIAAMEADEIQRILDYEMFSGPSRLGPIADAIRNYGNAESQQSAR